MPCQHLGQESFRAPASHAQIGMWWREDLYAPGTHMKVLRLKTLVIKEIDDRPDVLSIEHGILDEPADQRDPEFFAHEIHSETGTDPGSCQPIITSQPQDLTPANRLPDTKVRGSLHEVVQTSGIGTSM